MTPSYFWHRPILPFYSRPALAPRQIIYLSCADVIFSAMWIARFSLAVDGTVAHREPMDTACSLIFALYQYSGGDEPSSLFRPTQDTCCS